MNFKVGDTVWIYDAFEPYEGEAVVSGLDVDRVLYERQDGPPSYIDLRPKSHDTIRHLTSHDPKCFGWPGCDGCSDTERPAIVPPAPEFKVGDVVRLDDEHSPLQGFGGVVTGFSSPYVVVDFGADAFQMHEAAREYLCDPDRLTLLPPAPRKLVGTVADSVPDGYHDRKFDAGKSRIDLIPGEALEGVGDVLAYGCVKYVEDSWKLVPDAVKRYQAALMRHMAAIQRGEERDPESGKLHIDHVATNAAFLQYFARKP